MAAQLRMCLTCLALPILSMRRGGSCEQEYSEIIRCKVGGFLHLLESGNDLTSRRALTHLRTRLNTTPLCRRDIHGYPVASE